MQSKAQGWLAMWLVTGSLLTGCASPDDVGTHDTEATERADQSALRDFIVGLSATPLLPALDPQQTEAAEATELAGDTLQQCVYRRFEGTAHFETLVSFDPNADTLWPGAIVQTVGLDHGLLAPIGLARRPGTITLTGATVDDGASGAESSISRALEVPSLATTQTAIADMLHGAEVSFAAKASFVAEQAHSLEEAALKAGVSADWMTGSVKTSFEGDWTNERSTFVVRFVQSYYTASFAAPAAPEQMFTPDVTVEDASLYMGHGNPPGYVSSVTYGRMLFVKIESDAEASQLKAAIDAVFSLGTVDASASLSTDIKKVMNESTVTVFALGGNPNDAVEIMTSNDDRAERLRDYFLDGSQYSPDSPGVPISYTVRRLANNQTSVVASTLDYEIPDCSAAPQSVVLHVDGFDLPNNGETIGLAEIDYKVWVEHEGLDQLIAQGSASKIPDGGSIVLDQAHVVELTQRHGEELRVHAEVSESGEKHVFPSRHHSFVVDSATVSGSWTQSGVNAVGQSNGNLSVVLRYDLGVL
jgi:thiol-activated cytolysin